MTASTPGPSSGSKDIVQENPDLIKFREEWLAELRRRKNEDSAASPLPHTEGPQSVTQATTPRKVTNLTGPSEELFHLPAVTSASATSSTGQIIRTSHPAVKDGGISGPLHTSKALEKALSVYRRAVDHEQRGELDEAISLYRQAFRMDDKVDRAYQREQMLKNILKDQQAVKVTQFVSEDIVEDLSASFESAVTIKPAIKAEPVILTGPLATIMAEFKADLRFEPEKEDEPLFLNLLPEELVAVVLSKLDPTSLERFAVVCKKARVLTLDSGIWKKLVKRTYLPPQVPDLDFLISVIEQFRYNYRRVFVEQPRVRLDGVYIATCHYVRPGLSENHWVNVSHLITYHRYLRFFPNGQVLSLLANEEHPPQQVISLLKSTLRMKGLFVGQWRLAGTTVHISNLLDASSRSASLDDKPVPPELLAPPVSSNNVSSERTRYVFAMALNLRSRPLGRWNRMDIESYDSVHLETGDVHPVALKHERPFWFSKVRSFAV